MSAAPLRGLHHRIPPWGRPVVQLMRQRKKRWKALSTGGVDLQVATPPRLRRLQHRLQVSFSQRILDKRCVV